MHATSMYGPDHNLASAVLVLLTHGMTSLLSNIIVPVTISMNAGLVYKYWHGQICDRLSVLRTMRDSLQPTHQPDGAD